MDSAFDVPFSTGNTASAIQVRRSDDLAQQLREFDLSFRPTLVLVGGASGLTDEYRGRLQTFFTQVLAPLIQTIGGTVVDGGTDAGIMSMIGQARRDIQGTFPLVGVAAIGTVEIPNRVTDFDDACPLEPNHTHFVLTPGGMWGDESPWIARVASTLAQGFASMTILINGGRIAWQDVSHSVRVGRPVVVLAGSGRTADELADAIRGETINHRAKQLVSSGLLTALNIDEDDPISILRLLASDMFHGVDLTEGLDGIKNVIGHILCNETGSNINAFNQ